MFKLLLSRYLFFEFFLSKMIFGSDFQFDKNCDDAVRRAADGKKFSRSVFALAVITLYSRRTSSFSYNIIMCCLFVSPPKFLLLFFFFFFFPRLLLFLSQLWGG